MPGFQFIHIEAYGLAHSKRPPRPAKNNQRPAKQKLTIQEVIDEAKRTPGACPHISAPEPPIELLSVIPLDKLTDEVERRKKLSLDVSERKIREDALLLLAGVSSFPKPWAEITTDAQRDEVNKFFEAVIEFAKEQFGEALVNVTVHTDEKFPHCHFYAIPEPGLGCFNMMYLHPGITARENTVPARKGGSREDRKMRDLAYQKAMREFQDDYHDEVAILFGMDRIGPGRKRLSRDEWQARQHANDLLAEDTRLWKARLEQAEERVKELESMLVSPEI